MVASALRARYRLPVMDNCPTCGLEVTVAGVVGIMATCGEGWLLVCPQGHETVVEELE